VDRLTHIYMCGDHVDNGCPLESNDLAIVANVTFQLKRSNSYPGNSTRHAISMRNSSRDGRTHIYMRGDHVGNRRSGVPTRRKWRISLHRQTAPFHLNVDAKSNFYKSPADMSQVLYGFPGRRLSHDSSRISCRECSPRTHLISLATCR
jgi:hypothetical protein